MGGTIYTEKRCKLFGASSVYLVGAAERRRRDEEREWGGGGRWQKVEEAGKSSGIPMESLWNSYGIRMEQYAGNRLAIRKQQACMWLSLPTLDGGPYLPLPTMAFIEMLRTRAVQPARAWMSLTTESTGQR
jgi:hypothetical protein